jgi:LmbE family N-acetylglucosaminyl deacetylase
MFPTPNIGVTFRTQVSVMKSYLFRALLLILVGITGFNAPSFAQNDDPVEVLMVTAHPDDDALFTATVYKITHLLGGHVDLALLTNGEGGYNYSTLSEDIYGLNLDQEEIGRAYLPGIRKKELISGGRIMGVRNYFFMDQKDDYYNLDIQDPLKKWELDEVADEFSDIFDETQYDYVFVLMPVASTHAHHKASAVLAIRAVNKLPKEQRPLVLVGTSRSQEIGPHTDYTQLEGFPSTRIDTTVGPFEIDRTQKFGKKDRLNFDIIRNWVIAEHKTQGTMQKYANSGRVEQFWYLSSNPQGKLEATKSYFKKVRAAVPEID